MRLLDRSGIRRLSARLAALPILGVVACSLLYDVSGVQCAQTSDCLALGDAFEGTVCEDSVCVTPEPSDGSGGNGSGGGSDTGGGGGEGGGDGGCTNNGECIEANYGEPYICRDGSCIGLKLLEPTQQCPTVLGTGENHKNLRKPEPIVIGAYAPIGFTSADDPFVQNFELAIDEMNAGSNGGLAGGPGGSKRPFIAVVCKAIDFEGDADLDASMDHLIDTLEVPVIISALNAPELEESFSTKGHPGDVFFLSPLDADTNLVLVPDDGLLWHMLPEGRDLAPGYLALVPEIEEWLRVQRELAPTDPIKLAVVDTDHQFLIDIANTVVDDLTYNGGQSAFENEDNGHFTRIRTASAGFGNSSIVASAIDDIIDFAPDVILSMGTHESVQLIRDLEVLAWPPALGPKPFYVVSPYVFGSTELLTEVPAAAHQRMLGVNFAGAEDSALYKKYLSTLKSVYGNKSSLEGKENFYDAAFFAMYAIAAAGHPPRLTGKQVATAMLRLINPSSSAPEIEVGSDDVAVGLSHLNSGVEIGLMGTLGPPEFNTATGARAGGPSIYCIEDGMRVQNALLVDPGTGMLSGSQTCVPQFPPP